MTNNSIQINQPDHATPLAGCGCGGAITPELEKTLSRIRPKGNINGKLAFEVPTTRVLNTDSDFGHKLLCDGLTFTAGSACVFGCTFCYVLSIIRKNKYIQAVLKSTGRTFDDIVVRRANAVNMLRKSLLSRGLPKYGLDDTRVIYASPLVDIAPTIEMAKETLEMCLVILELTNWQIRLLSKSSLLMRVADGIPAHFQHRMIYGFSTGTLDDGVAKAIEVGTPLVSKRLKALRELQDRGLRTYGMACPILPRSDMEGYAEQMAQALRVDHCEHIWVEVMNVRGPSLTNTAGALRGAGYPDLAEQLEHVSGDKPAWEDYSRQTFLAFTKVIPANKLRFLQYITKQSRDWWRQHEHLGAVLLGKAAMTVPSDIIGREQEVVNA